MTTTKAQLYKTARIAQDYEADGYEFPRQLGPGQVVSVKYIGPGAFGGFNFIVNGTVVLNEIWLTDFVL
jgi:hypothetical protein